MCNNHSDLIIGIASKAVEAYEDCLTKLLEVSNMAVEVSEALLETLGVRKLNLCLRHTTVHLERESRGYQHGKVGLQARLAALDVEELLSTEVGTETCLSNGIVCQCHRHACGNH